MTREAVIVSTARTGIGKAYRGALNDTEAPRLASHVVDATVARAGIDPRRVDDVYLGCANQWGTQSFNIARLAVQASVLPDSVAAMSLDRKCSSGLNALAEAARGIITGDIEVAVSGGVESISLTMNAQTPQYRNRSSRVQRHQVNAYMAMIETAEIVAERYRVSREDQDAFAESSHRRAAAAQRAGLFADEIVPLTVSQATLDKQGHRSGHGS
jgi:acetyl-CoA C-acetyltransferase